MEGSPFIANVNFSLFNLAVGRVCLASTVNFALLRR